MIADQKLSNLQIEILKMFRFNLSESQLNEIRELLISYFSKSTDKEITRLWEANEWSEQTIENWLTEHHRTPYKNNS